MKILKSFSHSPFCVYLPFLALLNFPQKYIIRTIKDILMQASSLLSLTRFHLTMFLLVLLLSDKRQVSCLIPK